MTDRQLRRIPRHERPHKLDVTGAVLLIAATSTLLFGLNWGGVRYAWGSPEILGIFALCLLLWVAFVLRLRRAEEPLIPLTLLADRTVAGATLAASCSLGALAGPAAFMPIFFEAVFGLTATQSGSALLPLMLGTVVGATLSGRAMIHIRRYKLVPIAGLSISVAVASLLAARPAGLSLPMISGLLGAVSTGLGTVLSVSTISIQNAVAQHQLGTALAASNLFRQLGGALAVAVCGSILAAGGLGAAEHSHLDPLRLSAEIRTALIEAYRYIFVVTGIGAFGAILALLLVEERPLRGAGEGETVQALGKK